LPRSQPRKTTRLLALALASGLSFAPTLAGAQAPPMAPSVPGADAFVIRYYLTDAEGNRDRTMDSVDFAGFYNQARCECGQQIYTEMRLKVPMGVTYDITKKLQTFVGTMCATAQSNPLGMFRPCVRINAATVPTFTNGIAFTFHPVWMVNGVADITSADIGQATAVGSCAGGQGQAGVWMCADTNGSAGCQSDEFFITGTQNVNLAMGMSSGITYDYLPPLATPENISALPGDEAVIVSWEVLSSDIIGFRVLCEEVATGKPPPGKGLTPPALTAKQNGTLYFTKDNLCGGKPFSSFKGVDEPIVPGDDTTGDGTTTTDGTGTDGTTTDATTTDATGTGGTTTDATTTAATTGASTGDTEAIPPNCGDGVVDGDEGEECDDSANNGDNAECHDNCKLDVCGDGKAGPDEACDNGADNGESNLCSATCTLNASEGLTSLDWSYVCTDHLGLNTRSVRIEGLENGKEYNFLLVGYDRAGNPVISKDLIRAAPVPTNDLWDQCKAQGDVCGESGFCNVAGADDRSLALAGLIGLGLGIGGLIRRRRRNRA
jgi:hypothetical protein